MKDEWTFTHVGAEANKILMNVIKKSQVESKPGFVNSPIFSPSSNDNLTGLDGRQTKKSVF